MRYLNLTVEKIKRRRTFPFKVGKIFHFINYHGAVEWQQPQQHRNDLEVSIRIDSEAELCCDRINGVELELPFPNVVYKMPSAYNIIRCEKPRESFAFTYPASAVPRLREIGFLPDVAGHSFMMTPGLKYLIKEFLRLSVNLDMPMAIDRLDWTCFQLLGELSIAAVSPEIIRSTPEITIRKISAYLQMHYAENILIDDIASAHGMSHSHFFRERKKVFDISPLQYILDLRLEGAVWHLENSVLPVSRIIEEVNFSSATRFYRRFYQKYGMTPEAYRKQFHRS